MADSNKTELQFYVELIEEKLEGFSPYFPFSLAYAARTPRIGTFIELMFQDQGFNVVSIDCASLYPADDSDSSVNTNNINTDNANENSESPDYLSLALDNLRAQCLGVEKPIIMFQNVEVLKRSERYDNQMVSLLTEGMKLNDEQYIPVILTSTRSISSSYTNHVNQTLNFKYHMIDNNKRVKKICGKKEDDELLAALLENGQNPYEKKLNMDSLTPEQESSKESTYQKMAELSKKYHIGVWGGMGPGTGKSALMKDMKDIKIDVEQDFSHMTMPVIPDSIKKMKNIPTFSSDLDGKNIENKKKIPDLGLDFLYPPSPIDSDIHPPVKSEKKKENDIKNNYTLKGVLKMKGKPLNTNTEPNDNHVTIEESNESALNSELYPSFIVEPTNTNMPNIKTTIFNTQKPYTTPSSQSSDVAVSQNVEANILKLKEVFLNGENCNKNTTNGNQDNPNHKQKP